MRQVRNLMNNSSAPENQRFVIDPDFGTLCAPARSSPLHEIAIYYPARIHILALHQKSIPEPESAAYLL